MTIYKPRGQAGNRHPCTALRGTSPADTETYSSLHPLLQALANVLSWPLLVSSPICIYFQLEATFKALLGCHHLQASSQIPPGWKQFPPPLNILSCLCFSHCHSLAYLLLCNYFSLCLISPTGHELLEGKREVGFLAVSPWGLVLGQTEAVPQNICLMKPRNQDSSNSKSTLTLLSFVPIRNGVC